MSAQREALIVGGGVIGLSIGHYLASQGHSVRIIEQDQTLDSSCSEGNAGMIVPSHFIPLAAPGVIMQGLKWMLDPKSPFSLKPRLDLALARWIWLFWRHSTHRHVRDSECLLRDLSLESRRLHVELSEQGSFPLVQKGLLMLCQTQHGLDDEAAVAKDAHRLGLEAEVFDQKRLRELEPNAEIIAQGGVWWSQDCHLSPNDFLAALRKSISSQGGEFISGKAEKLIRKDGEIRGIKTADGTSHKAEATILAGGIDTPNLAKQASLSLPMQGGKGYSMTLPEPVNNPLLCSLLKEGRVAVTPMGNQLRVAGTMEICGSDTSIAKQRLAGIIESFCQFYPQYGPADFEDLKPWVGLRPCSPDGLPYIGKAPREKNLIIATGHSMMGLSLAPVTGKLVAELVAEDSTSIDISALAPGRFK